MAYLDILYLVHFYTSPLLFGIFFMLITGLVRLDDVRYYMNLWGDVLELDNHPDHKRPRTLRCSIDSYHRSLNLAILKHTKADNQPFEHRGRASNQ